MERVCIFVDGGNFYHLVLKKSSLIAKTDINRTLVKSDLESFIRYIH